MSTRAAREGCGRARATAAGQRGQLEENSNERRGSGNEERTQTQRQGPREGREDRREGVGRRAETSRRGQRAGRGGRKRAQLHEQTPRVALPQLRTSSTTRDLRVSSRVRSGRVQVPIWYPGTKRSKPESTGISNSRQLRRCRQ